MRKVIGIFAHVVKFAFGVCPKLVVVQPYERADASFIRRFKVNNINHIID